MNSFDFFSKKAYIIRIRDLSDSNRIRTHNHLVCKRTLNHLDKLPKWLGCVVSTYLYSVYSACFEKGVPWHSGKLQSIDSLWNTYVWLDNNIQSGSGPSEIDTSQMQSRECSIKKGILKNYSKFKGKHLC